MASEDAPEDREPLRAHVAACAACREHYQEVVLTAAQLARASKRSFEASEEDEDPAPPRRMSFLTARRTRGPSKLGKVTFVLLLVGTWFVWNRAASASAQVTCEALAGSVQCGKVQLAAGAGPSAVGKRAAVSTGPSSQARVCSGSSSIVLGAETAVVVDGARRLSIHLLEGELGIDGQATVVTAAGVVELDEAAGTVVLRGAELVVRGHSGTIRVTDASGERLVPPDGEVVLHAPGAGLRGD